MHWAPKDQLSQQNNILFFYYRLPGGVVWLTWLLVIDRSGLPYGQYFVYTDIGWIENPVEVVYISY
jgi:hypothetical protein